MLSAELQSWLPLLLFVLLRALFWCLSPSATPPDRRQRPPAIAGALPLLGNALQYKRDPAGLLSRAAAAHGGVFRIALPGFSATVLCDKRALRCFALAPERELSAVDATEALGFGTTLGALNVRAGTAVHKGILQSTLLPALAAEGEAGARGELHALVAEALRATIARAANAERAAAAVLRPAAARAGGRTGNAARTVELFALVREAVLRATATHLLGEAAVTSCGSWFVAAFTAFQDSVEAATARAVALPPWLAQWMVLDPVAAQRRALAARLAPSLALHWGAPPPLPGAARGGGWLRALHALRNQERGEGEGGSFSAAQAADLTCGLLFAAHKNAAIAVAQCVALLLERPAAFRAVVSEARTACAAPGPAACPLLCSALHETLRLSAHTIGAIRRVRAAWWAFEGADGQRYAVPRGSFVVASHVVPHLRDAAAFPAAAEFRAERFVAASGEDGAPAFTGHRLDPFTFTTFSHGTHACPGQRYALCAMRAALWTLLAEYDVSVSPQQPLPAVSFERATLAQRRGPCHVEVRARGA